MEPTAAVAAAAAELTSAAAVTARLACIERMHDEHVATLHTALQLTIVQMALTAPRP
jgi:hypothetical protein